MNDTGIALLEQEPSTEAPAAPVPAVMPTITRPATAATATSSPTVAERVLVPAMWFAVLAFAAITTPERLTPPPRAEAIVGDILGWAALIAIVGVITTAVAGHVSLRSWSGRLGMVGLAGLGTCAAIGHPILTSAWGLGQIATVSAGLAVTSRLTSSRI